MSHSWDPMDCSLQGSSVHGILQERILEWVAFPFSRRSSWPRNWAQISWIEGRFFTDWAMREVLVLNSTSSYLIRLNVLFCFYFGHLPRYNIKILQSNCDLTLWKGILFLPHVKMKYFWVVVILLCLYWYLYFDKNDVCIILSTQ